MPSTPDMSAEAIELAAQLTRLHGNAALDVARELTLAAGRDPDRLDVACSALLILINSSALAPAVDHTKHVDEARCPLNRSR
jgi:hypothetical protein